MVFLEWAWNGKDEEERMSLDALRDTPDIWKQLEERAELLARQQIEFDIDQGEEVITFRLGESGFSVPAQYVREVQPLTSWTPLPTTPSFVFGLVNVRGKILSAIDLRPLLDMKQTAVKENAFLLIVGAHGTEIGVLADSVDEVRRGDRELSPTLSAVAGHGMPWVLGLDKSLNLVIDPPQLFADPRVIVNDEAA
jgi:purine-binding chemotaxis protein CheW